MVKELKTHWEIHIKFSKNEMAQRLKNTLVDIGYDSVELVEVAE